MPVNVQKKADARVNTVQTLQRSLGIQGPGKLPGKGACHQTLQESLAVGNSGRKRTATKIGRNHVRDSMGL
jgi:hypothetical protein